MPQIKSAEKRRRQNDVRRQHNQHYRTMMRTFLKKARHAIEENPADSGTPVRKAVAVIDRVAQKGIIKKNTAARMISRLVKASNRSQG